MDRLAARLGPGFHSSRLDGHGDPSQPYHASQSLPHVQPAAPAPNHYGEAPAQRYTTRSDAFSLWRTGWSPVRWPLQLWLLRQRFHHIHFAQPHVHADGQCAFACRYPTQFGGDVTQSWESLDFFPYHVSTAANVLVSYCAFEPLRFVRLSRQHKRIIG